jgi:hypothetical protein
MVRMCINRAPGESCKERMNETLVLPIIDVCHSGVPYSFCLSLYFGLLKRQLGVRRLRPRTTLRQASTFILRSKSANNNGKLENKTKKKLC